MSKVHITVLKRQESTNDHLVHFNEVDSFSQSEFNTDQIMTAPLSSIIPDEFYHLPEENRKELLEKGETTFSFQITQTVKISCPK